MTATRRVEQLLAELQALPDGIQREVSRAVAVVLDAGGDGLVRVLEIAARHDAVDDLLADPQVRGLLELHGLVPDPSTPVEIGRRPHARCELCARAIDSAHRHVADLEDRRMLCACDACDALFRVSTAGRYRSVPDRRMHLGPLVDPPAWTAQIPVGLAFCVRSSGRTTLFYPGPAGATEAELDLEGLDDLDGLVPEGIDLADDVEAVLVHATPGTVEAWVVPVDVCYELTGLMRNREPADAASAAAEFLARL